MPIEFVCPKCGRPVKVDDRYAGRSGRCQFCKSPLTAPSPPAASPGAPGAFTASPPAAKSDNPFAFTAPPPPPIEEADGPPPDPEAAELWDAPRRGFRLAWAGTVMFTGVPVAVLVLALTSNLLFGSIRLTGLMFAPLDDPVIPSNKPNPFAVMLLRGAELLLVAVLVLGPIVRMFGFIHCLLLPRGAPGRIWALAMIACEAITLASFGLLFAAGYFPIIALMLPASTLLPLVGMIAATAGVVVLLLFLRAVAASLQSKPLQVRVKNYAIWFGATVGTFVLLSIVSSLVRSRSLADFVFGLGTASDLLSCSGIVLFLIAPIVLLLKYMNLLDLAWDEVRKRAGRWRPA